MLSIFHFEKSCLGESKWHCGTTSFPKTLWWSKKSLVSLCRFGENLGLGWCFSSYSWTLGLYLTLFYCFFVSFSSEKSAGRVVPVGWERLIVRSNVGSVLVRCSTWEPVSVPEQSGRSQRENKSQYGPCCRASRTSGCGRVFNNSLVRKWETESLYLKGTRTCDSPRLAHHPIAGDQKFSKFPTSFIDPEVAFEVRHLWEWKILSSAKGCDGWLKPKSEWCSFFFSRATNLLRINSSSEKIMKLTGILIYQTIKPYGNIFPCQLIWPLVNILLRLHHLLIRFSRWEEKQSWRVFGAQLFTSVVKNQFQVCSQSNISQHFIICGTFCANLLWSIVTQLSARKSESSKIF